MSIFVFLVSLLGVEQLAAKLTLVAAVCGEVLRLEVQLQRVLVVATHVADGALVVRVLAAKQVAQCQLLKSGPILLQPVLMLLKAGPNLLQSGLIQL